MTVSVVVEGDTDLPVVRKLARDAGLQISVEIDCAGKGRLDEDLPAFNSAAKGSPWFVLRDLDQDAPCAGEFISSIGIQISRWMCFRIAVRELESWLLADVKGLAEFLRVKPEWVPANPDLEPDPTITLVSLARRSRSRSIQRAMAPAHNSGAVVGPLYEARIIEFGEIYWDLERACSRSPSLQRARKAFQSLGRSWKTYVDGVS